MNSEPTTVPNQPPTETQVGSNSSLSPSVWRGIQGRLIGGLLLVLPILITLWVVYWLYSSLEKHVIDPIARMVLWKVGRGQPNVQLPYWFESYAAPLIAVAIILLLLYGLGFLAHTGLRQFVDSVLLRVPVISVVYNGVRNVFQTLDKQRGQQTKQRMVLVGFPHPGMRTLAFVTGECQDIETQKRILCVYVPTTPVPTSGYFMLIPEDEVTPLNWSSEQGLQAIISGGLTAPTEIRYFAK